MFVDKLDNSSLRAPTGVINGFGRALGEPFKRGIASDTIFLSGGFAVGSVGVDLDDYDGFIFFKLCGDLFIDWGEALAVATPGL